MLGMAAMHESEATTRQPVYTPNSLAVALQVAHRILSLTAEYMELVKRFPAPMISVKGVSNC